MPDLQEVLNWVIPLAWILGGLAIGILFEIIFIKRLQKWAKRTRIEWDDIIVKSLRKAFIFWFFLVGLFLAVVSAELSAELSDISFRLISALATLVGILVLARLAAGFTEFGFKKYKDRMPAASIVTNLVRGTVLVIGIVFILQQNLGINLSPVIAALGVGGLATALAMQDTLSNLFYGFQLIVSRQVRPGDIVTLETGKTGIVVDIRWRNTTIRDWSNNMIIVPNSKIAQSLVTNQNLPNEFIWDEHVVGVSYDSDLQHVEDTAIAVARDTYQQLYEAESEAEPLFFFMDFADSAITFKIKILVERTSKIKYHSAYMKNLHKRFGREGIEIPFPIRTIISGRPSRDPETGL